MNNEMRYIDLGGKIYISSRGFEDIVMNFVDIEKVDRKRNRRVRRNDYCSIISNDIIDNFPPRCDAQVTHHTITEMNYCFFLGDINSYSLRKDDVIIEDNITIEIFNNMKFSSNICKSLVSNVREINRENDYFS